MKRTKDFDEENMPKYIISVAAQIIGLHPQTMRQYEKRGFVSPYRLGTLRLYSEEDLITLQKIKELADEGIPTSGIERILALEERMSELERRVKTLEREKTILQERIRKETAPLPVKIEYRSVDFLFFEDDEDK